MSKQKNTKTKTEEKTVAYNINLIRLLGRTATTGYAAKEAERGRCSSSVHVFINGKGLCGYKPTGKMRIQWCACGIEYSYIECDRCKEKVKELLAVSP